MEHRQGDTLAVEAGKHLLRKGFIPASPEGKAKRMISQEPILGILWRDPTADLTKKFFGLIKKPPKGDLLGAIYFQDESMQATPEHWVFDIYGRQYIKWIKKLGDEMAGIYNIKVSFRFYSEEPGREK